MYHLRSHGNQDSAYACTAPTEAEYIAELEGAITEAAARIAEVEVHCPCGARPESLRTHPHVLCCPVELAKIALARVMSQAVKNAR